MGQAKRRGSLHERMQEALSAKEKQAKQQIKRQSLYMMTPEQMCRAYLQTPAEKALRAVGRGAGAVMERIYGTS